MSKYSHAAIHAFSIGANLLILEAGLNKVKGKHTRHSDQACDAAIDDFRQHATHMVSTILLAALTLLGHLNYCRVGKWCGRTQ